MKSNHIFSIASYCIESHCVESNRNRIALHRKKGWIVSHRIGTCFICIFNVSYRWLCIEMRIVSASVMRCTSLKPTIKIIDWSFFVSGQTYKISRGSNYFFPHCTSFSIPSSVFWKYDSPTFYILPWYLYLKGYKSYSKAISNKCCSFELSITNSEPNCTLLFSWAANQHIRMISKASCDTED